MSKKRPKIGLWEEVKKGFVRNLEYFTRRHEGTTALTMAAGLYFCVISVSGSYWAAKFWLGLQNDFDLEEEQGSKSKQLNAIARYQRKAA